MSTHAPLLTSGRVCGPRIACKRKSPAVLTSALQTEISQGRDVASFVPIVDLTSKGAAESSSSCRANVLATAAAVRNSLSKSSCVIVRDPRVSQADNDRFLNQMENYFSRPVEVKMHDARPDLAYQVGATPSGIETPRCCSDEALQAQMHAQSPADRATPPTGPDVKWRYFWSLRSRSQARSQLEQHRFSELEPVIPQGMPDWAAVMDTWGYKLLDTAMTVSELLALAYGLPKDQFTSLLHGGPHLLAPTGTDLKQHGKVGTVFAGYHYDINFLTIHGRSRYPGLFIWLRDGTRVAVRLPPGCILIQAGRQLEWLTGGDIIAGMHEVVCTADTLEAADKVARESCRPLWRVSSTVFSHVNSDAAIAPLPMFADRATASKYRAMTAGEYVYEELEAIKLAQKKAR